MKSHPAAEIFPMLGEAELADLPLTTTGGDGSCAPLRPPVQPPPASGDGHPGERADSPGAADARKRRRKQPKRYLPRKTYNKLAALTAGFADMLRHAPDLQPWVISAIPDDLRGFRSDLLALIRAQFPLRRGRPPDPLLDEACHMIAQGKTVPQVLRQQIPNWDEVDAYTRYLAAKGLRQAACRRDPQAAAKRGAEPPKPQRKKPARNDA